MKGIVHRTHFREVRSIKILEQIWREKSNSQLPIAVLLLTTHSKDEYVEDGNGRARMRSERKMRTKTIPSIYSVSVGPTSTPTPTVAKPRAKLGIRLSGRCIIVESSESEGGRGSKECQTRHFK